MCIRHYTHGITTPAALGPGASLLSSTTWSATWGQLQHVYCAFIPESILSVQVFDLWTASLIKSTVSQNLEVQNLKLHSLRRERTDSSLIFGQMYLINNFRNSPVEHCTGRQETLQVVFSHPQLLSTWGRNLCAFACLAIRWGESYLIPETSVKSEVKEAMVESIFSSLAKQCWVNPSNYHYFADTCGPSV